MHIFLLIGTLPLMLGNLLIILIFVRVLTVVQVAHHPVVLIKREDS